MRREAVVITAFGSQCATQWHPRKRPTVGAGSSQREDSPARLVHRPPSPPFHPPALPPTRPPATRECPPLPRRIVIKNVRLPGWHGMRREAVVITAFGSHPPRKGIPANADCRGGVFATRRFPRPSTPQTDTHTMQTPHAAHQWRPHDLCSTPTCRIVMKTPARLAPVCAYHRCRPHRSPAALSPDGCGARRRHL